MHTRFLAAIALAALGCRARESGGPPDRVPALLNDSLPFKYPVGYYMQMIDDSLTLRLHIDTYGRPVPESTAIAEHAKYAAFDTAALQGASALVFRPAERQGKAVALTILFPVKFQVPTRPRDSLAPPSPKR